MKPDSNGLFDGLKQLVREAVREELQEALSSQTAKAPKLLLSTEAAAAMIEVRKPG